MMTICGTHSPKYHAPTTAAHVTLNTPLPTHQLHTQTVATNAISQFAHPLTCHSHADGFPRGWIWYPMRSNRNVKVKKGIETIRLTRRTSGDRPNKNGLFCNNRVVRVSNEEAVWISLGKSTNRRAVKRARTRGMIAKSLSPTVSPHVGSVSASHMKLPMKAQIAEMNNVTGMKKDVTIMTGLMKICKRKMCI